MKIGNENNKYFARMRGSSYAITFKASSRQQALEIAASNFEVSIGSSYIILSATPAKGICYQEK